VQLGVLVSDADAKHVVRGVAFHPRDWALQRVIGWSMLAAGSVAKEREMSACPRWCGLWETLLAFGDHLQFLESVDHNISMALRWLYSLYDHATDVATAS